MPLTASKKRLPPDVSLDDKSGSIEALNIAENVIAIDDIQDLNKQADDILVRRIRLVVEENREVLSKIGSAKAKGGMRPFCKCSCYDMNRWSNEDYVCKNVVSKKMCVYTGYMHKTCLTEMFKDIPGAFEHVTHRTSSGKWLCPFCNPKYASCDN